MAATPVPTSFERGVVDAAGDGVLAANRAAGFHAFARYPLKHEITLKTIFSSLYPFIGLQLVGLGLVLVFPAIAMWLVWATK